jgi:peptidoglycan/xylan/chitin deacetylase (PgdA/CDA1 family)
MDFKRWAAVADVEANRGSDTAADRASWSPSRAIRASAACHLGIAAALLARPEIWPGALAVLGANHVCLTLAGLWPRSRILGPNWTRLPKGSRAEDRVAITFDDGPDPVVTPTVLDLLDVYRVKASFFCVGCKVVQYPEICAEIGRRGHAVENHSFHHRHTFSLLGPRGLAWELRTAQQVLTALAGTPPRFFRAPAGLRSPLLDPVLVRLGLILVSWTRRGFDTRRVDARAVAASLLRDVRGGDILLLHDGNAARTQSGRAVVLEALPRVLDVVMGNGLRPVTLRSALA